MFVSTQRIHVVLQTPTQHRKTTILQLKINLIDEIGDKRRCFIEMCFKEAMNKQVNKYIADIIFREQYVLESTM